MNIRNFSIIAHVDHGKSTLADRMLERTGTIEARHMRDQVLDKMDLERERGITIKMQPARMKYKSTDGADYILNLIDTPGHIDFAYEVSRALSAVEGVILLVDSTQGIQAQTLTTLGMARKAGCVIIPVLSKIDSPAARVDEVSSTSSFDNNSLRPFPRRTREENVRWSSVRDSSHGVMSRFVGSFVSSLSPVFSGFVCCQCVFRIIQKKRVSKERKNSRESVVFTTRHARDCLAEGAAKRAAGLPQLSCALRRWNRRR